MPDQADAILSAALNLPEADRFRVIDGLLASVPMPGLWDIDDPAFADELERRSAEFDSGAVQGVAWEQMRADAMRRAGATVRNITH